MARNKKQQDSDGKSAAAGTDLDLADGTSPGDRDQGTDGGVFDAPMGDKEAIAQLIALNHERTVCALRWEDAKTEASDAKKELDNASNAISLLIDRIDRIDRQRTGDAAQPVLRTLTAAADAHA